MTELPRVDCSRATALCAVLAVLCQGPLFAARTKSIPIWPKIHMRGEIDPKPVPMTASKRRADKAVMQYGWMTEKWTGNNAPYAAMRAKLKREFAVSTAPQTLVAKYARRAAKSPNSALAQYAWADSVLLAGGSPAYVYPHVVGVLGPVTLALAEAPAPHTYDYDRIRARIVFSGMWGAARSLFPMYERILVKNPRDFPILYARAYVYATSLRAPERKLGFNLIQHLRNEFPSAPEYFDLLGNYYYYTAVCEGNVSDYDKFIVLLTKAMSAYPPNSPRGRELPALMQRGKIRLKYEMDYFRKHNKP